MFGLLKRGGRVYTKVIPDTKSKTLMGIIQKRIVPDSIVYSDGYHSYNVLDVSELNTTASITQNCLLTNKIISMELKTFGTKLSVICVDLMVFRSNIFRYFLRSVSGDLITPILKPN